MFFFLLSSFLNTDLSSIQNLNTLTLEQEFVPSVLFEKQEKTIAPLLEKNENMAIFSFDVTTGQSFYTQNIEKPLPIASLTKLMTALLVFEELNLDDVVFVPVAATKVSGVKLGLFAYEKVRVIDLLQSILISSANDSALALATAISGNEQSFVKRLNKKAQKIGLTSAFFQNATGLDIYDKKSDSYKSSNYMNAQDLATLSLKLLQYDLFREIVAEESYVLKSEDEKFTHTAKTTNKLLGELGIKGLKTGYERSAGECLVTLGEKNSRDILIIVLGARDRFGQTKKLLSWIYDSYQ